MKPILACMLFLSIVSCNLDITTANNEAVPEEVQAATLAIATVPMFQPYAHPHPYELQLNMKKIKADVYDFELSMDLHNGSYYVSPNAKRDFKGKFTLFMDDTNKLELVSELLETPGSVEEYDPHPFVNGNVNWVRVDTKYNQKIQRISKEDFKVSGWVQFTIEPRCTLEKIPFSILYSEGEMTVRVDGC
jgi:hypothetical protein